MASSLHFAKAILVFSGRHYPLERREGPGEGRAPEDA